MPTLRLSLILALAFASWAQAAPSPHVVARAAESSGALGGTTLAKDFGEKTSAEVN